MFNRTVFNEAQAKIDALDRSLAIIEFSMDGTVLHANQNFLRLMKYSLSDVQSRHHRIFVDKSYAETAEYAAFWDKLKDGQYVTGEFLRLDKEGDSVWLEATYNPVLDARGKPIKVVKFAADISAKKKEINRLLTMIDNVPVAVMTADLKDNFKIDYMNATSRKTLGTIDQHLPVRVDDMLGRSFDIFHKNPSHQRTMLADASRLPHSTKIRVGPETLNLRVTAVNDEKGQYLGPMLTWAVVTAQVNMETDVKRVVEAVGSAIQEMQSSAEGLMQSAESARHKASSVASSSEQMNGAIQEISGQVGRVSERAQQIAAQAGTTDATMRQLAENARKVDAVV
ncbi:MAG: PAS domain-containing protein, partial [Methylobacterium organophilum]|nr:PAS domain-containing protein [Methylobacterium organophilum]